MKRDIDKFVKEEVEPHVEKMHKIRDNTEEYKDISDFAFWALAYLIDNGIKEIDYKRYLDNAKFFTEEHIDEKSKEYEQVFLEHGRFFAITDFDEELRNRYISGCTKEERETYRKSIEKRLNERFKNDEDTIS